MVTLLIKSLDIRCRILPKDQRKILLELLKHPNGKMVPQMQTFNQNKQYYNKQTGIMGMYFKFKLLNSGFRREFTKVQIVQT